MNKNKQYGFTLIELLAVILILGVIALIAIPIVTNIIRDAKEGALLRSAEGMANSAENYYGKAVLTGSNITYTFDGPTYTGLSFSGKKYTGIVKLDKDGNSAVALYDSSICAYKDYTEAGAKIIEVANETECLAMITTEVVDKPLSVELDDNMVPIRYDVSTSKWVKADKTNTSNNWYNYANKEWANAVLVTDASRENYKTAPVGTEVKWADTLAYYVYVPRYRYKLFNANNGSKAVQEIDIEFENKDTTKSCGGNACTPSRIYETGTNDEWLTHPAFTFGDATNGYTELAGIWVGKYELTGNETTPTIKPNMPSLRSKTVSSLWTIVEKFKSGTYGLNGTTMDAHMAKNMEWGAVAYLAQSKYGANTEIYINNSNTYTTGCAGNSPTDNTLSNCANAYNTTGGFKASTTGNITGIYDMSGGSWEYTMGNMASSTANYEAHTMYVSGAGDTFGTYNYADLPEKYYDIYDYDASNDLTHSRGLLGDSTKETLAIFGNGAGGWYSDYSYFPSAANSWFLRGSYYIFTTDAGLYGFDRSNGEAKVYYTTRAVLVNE